MPDVVSIVALSLTCFHGCVKGLVVLSKAKYYNQDVLDIRLQTELTLQSLTTWADEVGLTREPPTLLMSAENASLVPGILSRLETLLSDLNRLQERYGLYLQPTCEDVRTLDDAEDTSYARSTQCRKFTRLADAAGIFCKRTEPWKRLRWITLDDKKFDRLLDKVKTYIGELENFLEQAKQERRDRLLEFCFRDAILNANGQQELAIIGKEYGQSSSKAAIAASARLKQTRLNLGLLDPQADVAELALSQYPSSTTSAIRERHDAMILKTPPPLPRDMKLSKRLLTLSRKGRSQPLRTLALYDDSVVLLEWKNVPTMTDPAISKRVNQVATFLQDLGPTFHSLQCRGFIEDRVDSRYGYIFGLPDDFNKKPINSQPSTPNSAAMQKMPELRSLRQMLDCSSTPSLNTRLSLAVTLLDTLLNLHTSGWLHKELRSDNIIFIRKAECDEDNTITGDLSNYSIFISGYVYSRLDDPEEQTESMQSEVEADLYRHPSLLRESRQPYSKSLDIFSVGCTLLEIGLWSSLRQVLENHSTTDSRASLPSLPDRSIKHSIQVTEDNTDSEQKGASNSDLMKLKHDLLLSPLDSATKQSQMQYVTMEKSTPPAAKRSMMMRPLEAAMGKRYTRVVEECLSAANTIQETKVDEHEFALELEMGARDTVRDILKAV
jgi:hypothetical protein